ncbi:MAG: diphosphomevalonate decarboxylase [Acidobacteriota bacterium]
MSGKATFAAPSNIALIKYWGTRDAEETVPYNQSLSMTLSRCLSTTTVEKGADLDADEVMVSGDSGELVAAGEPFAAGVVAHLDRLRKWSDSTARYRVATMNSFPMGAGLASSASGFAALTLAFVASLERNISSRQASILARLSGSGSAARSVVGGYVEWPADDECSAASFARADHWELCDVVAILDEGEKEVSSKEGHRLAPTSPYFQLRQDLLPERIERVRRAILERSFSTLGPIVEEEALDLHLIAMSSRPPIFYWQPGTLTVLKTIREMRSDGVEVCATMDAGANVHAICTPESEDEVVRSLGALSEVERLIQDRVGEGPRRLDNHLL